MIVCPLCEHTQVQGEECEVCGRRFPAGLAAPVPVAPVDGLERTAHDAVAARAAPPGDAVPELEATRFAPVTAPEEHVPELEATRAEPVPASVVSAADAVPDVERTAAAPPTEEAALLPPLPVCRYCRTPAGPEERICGRCGMRLPMYAPAPGTPAAAEEGRICGCGARVRGEVCPACGARR